MINKSKLNFSPEVLVETPVPSPAIPNELGTHAVYTVSKYTIETNSNSKEIRILDIETGKSKLFSDDEKVEEPKWLINDLLIWKRKADGGMTELWVGNGVSDEKNAYLVGKIDASINGIQTALLPNGTIALTFGAPVSEDGTLLNTEKLSKVASTAREYETIRVRFWMSYHDPYGHTVWYTTLEKTNSKWKLGKPPVDALKNTPWLYPWETDSPMFGPGGGAKTGANGILLATTDDVNHDVAEDLRTALLYVPLSTFTESEPPSPILVQHKDKALGGISSIAFSPDGKTGAMLRQKDSNSPNVPTYHLYLFDLDDPSDIQQVDILNEAQEYWDISPVDLLFSEDGSTIYLIAENRGRRSLFAVSIIQTKDEKGYEPVVARQLSKSGSVDSVHLIKRDAASSYQSTLFINSNSMVDSRKCSILYPESGHDIVISSATENGSLLGLSPVQISEFSFKSQGDYQVQCFIVRPSRFQEGKSYPCMFAVHGGPQGAWLDGWSWRWNAALFAEQGYIVILPNITGSSGFGEEFLAAVDADWGGRPYQDLVACWEYIEKNLHYIDVDRVVALGGSFGGYMMNWVAGQPLAKKFKTLVNHDGIFSFASMLASDVAYSLKYDLGGNLWDDQKLWDKYDPARYTDNWTQPMLVIHSDLDYRCPIEAGLCAYNTCLMKGIEARFLNYPNEGHLVLKKENSLHWNKTVIGWCNKYVKVEDGIKLEPPVSEKNLRGRNKKLAFHSRQR